MHTDVAGAVRLGIDILFVSAGIHREDIHGSGQLAATALEQFWASHDLRPTAAIGDLLW
jgi:ribonucleotide monophosphatase NagD (HAD superfamily)